jgi:hypothetical protein
MNLVWRRSQVLRHLPGDSGRSVTLAYQTRSSDRSPGRAWARRLRKRCKFRPGARAGSQATGERVNLGQVARRDPKSLDGEPTQLLGYVPTWGGRLRGEFEHHPVDRLSGAQQARRRRELWVLPHRCAQPADEGQPRAHGPRRRWPCGRSSRCSSWREDVCSGVVGNRNISTPEQRDLPTSRSKSSRDRLERVGTVRHHHRRSRPVLLASSGTSSDARRRRN